MQRSWQQSARDGAVPAGYAAAGASLGAHLAGIDEALVALSAAVGGGALVVATASGPVATTTTRLIWKPAPVVAGALTLPAGASHVTGSVWVKDGTGAAEQYPVTLTPALGETIEGDASFVLAANYGGVEFVFDGVATWYLK